MEPYPIQLVADEQTHGVLFRTLHIRTAVKSTDEIRESLSTELMGSPLRWSTQQTKIR